MTTDTVTIEQILQSRDMFNALKEIESLLAEGNIVDALAVARDAITQVEAN